MTVTVFFVLFWVKVRRKLESAAYQLDSLVGEAVGAMGKFVDGALEAAAGTVPLPLMAEVKEVLKGVEDEAMTQLSPLGEVGTLSNRTWYLRSVFLNIDIAFQDGCKWK